MHETKQVATQSPDASPPTATLPVTHTGMADVDSAVADFEAAERARLGLPDRSRRRHWHDPVPRTFTAEQRAHTTILTGGLTRVHDAFIEAAITGLGYRVEALSCADNDAFRIGKEFGNRAQCNPTYFTVGNLLKHLQYLRDERGLATEEIVKNYLFVTAGSCGPCRFGTYVTEYRKALRDSGFDGFRVLLFEQSGDLAQATGEEAGLQIDARFTVTFLKSILIGDVLNLLGYRIRPYELESGATDAALEQCKTLIADALSGRRPGLIRALWRSRKVLAAVPVDRTRVKPRVAVIGEIWAMTTEGDGNYRLQRFLEDEGAEVDIQVLTAWILFLIWEKQYDMRRRVALRATDEASLGLGTTDVAKILLYCRLGDRAIRTYFQAVARLMGLRDYTLPDMDEVARVSHDFYNNEVRGGEGHMEVGKLILNTLHNKVNMTISVKPFGCMPSSGVSDGVQSLITDMYPDAIFVPIETSGDGAANVYSRVLMQLFKAKQAAAREVELALDEHGLDHAQMTAALEQRPRMRNALYRSRHSAGCTAADLVHDVGRRRRPVRGLWHAMVGRITGSAAAESH